MRPCLLCPWLLCCGAAGLADTTAWRRFASQQLQQRSKLYCKLKCMAAMLFRGLGGPHDSGTYNSSAWDTGFFVSEGGNWDSEYGRFFLSW